MADFRTEHLGESALVIDAGPDAVGIAAHIESFGLPGVVDVVPAFDQVAVYFEGPDAVPDTLDPFLSSFRAGILKPGKKHVVPVWYERGEDIKEVLAQLSLTASEFVSSHSGRVYDCKAIGFCPGFPYLGWLDDRIGKLGRLESPRLRVEPGSVAIAGRMTGVYPLLRPGGWWLVGRTPLTLVDPDDSYYPISVGDTVEFTAIDDKEFERLQGERL